jgi:hypothetical protein
MKVQIAPNEDGRSVVIAFDSAGGTLSLTAVVVQAEWFTADGPGHARNPGGEHVAELFRELQAPGLLPAWLSRLLHRTAPVASG